MSGGVLGPAALGRGALVAAGQPAPSGLASVPRFVIDDGVVAGPGPVVDKLHRVWVTRTPYVVELRVAPAALQAPQTSSAPVHDHDPRFLFGLERLAYLVWANTVDHRGDTPTWWHAVKAVRANPALLAEGPADVVLPDGRPAWVDGGPRGPVDLGGRPDAVALLHRDDTERGVIAEIRPGSTPVDVDGLACDQAAAVVAAEAAVRVAAPAGSGKTRVLTSRLREVLAVRGHPTDSVLALAYNTAAAAELRARTRVPGVRAATVHAHALGLLRRHLPSVEVLDEHDARQLLGRLVDPPRRANVDPLQPYLDALERIRIALVSPEQVVEEHDDVENLPEVFSAYRQALADRGVVDFPEMVYRAIELLLTEPAIRRAEQRRVAEVLVDEFQDLTPAYLLFIRLLASPQLQCFGVGDDDQVIYGHAGATPDYLLHFDTLFPGAVDHPLTVNYRCPTPVVEGATRLLDHNHIRLVKQITPGPSATTDGVSMVVVDRHGEAEGAGARIAQLHGDGVSPSDIAVLARVKVALLGTQAELATRGIACRSPIGEWLLERTGVRAALAYLRLATDVRMSGQDLAEVLHRPLRPVPSVVKDTLRRRHWTVEDLRRLGDRQPGGGARRGLAELARDLEVLRRRAARQPTAELLRFVNDVIGLGDVADSLDRGSQSASTPSSAAMASSHFDDLQALLQVADHCPDPAAFGGFLLDVVAHPAAGGPAVTLSTIHSVKGLEWPHVLVVGLSEGVCPHRLATSQRAMEEERRVFHVAVTRARATLTLLTPKAGASRFVAEFAGRPSPVARGDAARPGRGRPTSTRAAARPKGRGRSKAATYRASPGLVVSAPGGLSGTVETVTEEGALVRTPRGSLVRVRFGDEVRVEGTLGRLSRPA